jgi:hypothetical protein
MRDSMAAAVRVLLNLIPQRSMEAELGRMEVSYTTSQTIGSEKGSRPLFRITPQKAFFGIPHLKRDM